MDLILAYINPKAAPNNTTDTAKNNIAITVVISKPFFYLESLPEKYASKYFTIPLVVTCLPTHSSAHS